MSQRKDHRTRGHHLWPTARQQRPPELGDNNFYHHSHCPLHFVATAPQTQARSSRWPALPEGTSPGPALPLQELGCVEGECP